MSIPLFRVDAFTSVRFGGNPAAVCVLPSGPSSAWMQRVADELRLPATVFVTPGSDGALLRWFMPGHEIELCGHGTVAASHVLFSEGLIDDDHIRYVTRHRGPIDVSRDDSWYWMDLAAEPAAPAASGADLEAALGVTPIAVSRSAFDVIVELASAAEVESARPDFNRLAGVEARAVILTAATEEKHADVVSRVFEPRMGVDEDHATGSVHCALGPYWANRLGRSALTARQASPRGGMLRVEMRGPRVHVGGEAVTVARGALTAEPS